MTQTIAESWLAEGIEKGRQVGREEGREEGREKGREEGQLEGQLRAARDILRSILEDRFGPLPVSLIEQIEASRDPEQLKAAALRSHHVDSLEQLRL